MSESQYPGAFIAEGTGPPPIVGVGLGGTVFIGPTLTGPAGMSGPFTSFADFEKAHGGFADFGTTLPPMQRRNYLAFAARAFFENGGKRLFVMRVGGDAAVLPTPADYRAALEALRTTEDIAVVAAPGHSAHAADEYLAIRNALIAHAEDRAVLRFAVLDPPPGIEPDGVLQLRASLNNARAALYYPWVSVADSPGPGVVNVPPSGFACGVLERVAFELGLFKPPSNQPLVGAVALERSLTSTEADLIGHAGVNTLRVFPGRGLRVWGARTLSDDSESRYISVRRYTDYLIRSIDAGLQWVAFEPNGEDLWVLVRRALEEFLVKEWRGGGLMGARPDEAFFVRCDRTTMTQEDIDSGRLVCLVGVATVKPAEFVIFRIGQWTADSDNPDDPP